MINENELTLIIEKKELGTLETNANLIKEKVKTILKDFKIENYNIDNIDKAKQDKILLNKTSKILNDERIKIEKEFVKPFEVFKATVKETTTMIKETSDKINEVVKNVEDKEKADKKIIIEKIFNDNNKTLNGLLTFEKIFDSSWLNKGAWKGETFKQADELLDIIKKIDSDIEAISNLNSKYEVELKNDYLNNFNLGDIIKKNNELLAKEELLKSTTKKQEEMQANETEQKINKMLEEPVKEDVNDVMKCYDLHIEAPLSKMYALKKFMSLNDIKYSKIEGEEK